MARNKSKKPQQEDTSMLLEPPAPRSRTNKSSCASPALLFFTVFTVGASAVGWFSVQQQHSLDQLSESLTTMQRKVTNLQQVMEMTDAQTDTGLGVEERILALEEAQKQAQQKAEVTLATSEKLKNADLYSNVWALHEEMETQWAEIKQVSLSITALGAMFKNHSEEFDAVTERVVATMSSSSALAENVAGLTSAVSSVCSRVGEQVASVEALNAQLGGQSSELNDLRELLYLHNVALHANNQEMAAIKELMETKQTMRAQALEEMLSSVQTTLDEQFFTSQNLHSSVKAQLQTFHTQLVNGRSWSMKLKSNEEDPAAAKAEEAEEDDKPPEQIVEGDVTEEEEEEDITPEEEEEEEIAGQGQSGEQEVTGETAVEEVTEENTESDILDESLEEELKMKRMWKSGILQKKCQLN
ncbi:neurofilament light polypeptide-like [Trachinotus anak]|uniref:neurofilament light polypeptide-like n=1 Tax=Trachinotus anak TaxID=443729 RepID=UPI0039F1EA92